MKSSRRSRPPVVLTLVSSPERLLEKGLADLPKFLSSGSRGSTASRAEEVVLEFLPKVLRKPSKDLENGPRFSKVLLMPGAAMPRSVRVGVVCSAKRPSRSIAGPSCSRKAGKAARFWAMAPRWLALARATLPLSLTKPTSRSRSAARGAVARSPSTARSVRTLFSLARIAKTRSRPCRVGLERRKTALRSEPRPAKPAPSSLMMIVRRWASGRRVMSPSRSGSTGLWVFATGRSTWPAPSWPEGIVFKGDGKGVPSTRGWVGRQSTNFSPIRAWGRISQEASWRKSWKPGLLMFRTTAALALGVGVTEPTVPTLTPSILTSSPTVRLPASSKIARTA